MPGRTVLPPTLTLDPTWRTMDHWRSHHPESLGWSPRSGWWRSDLDQTTRFVSYLVGAIHAGGPIAMFDLPDVEDYMAIVDELTQHGLMKRFTVGDVERWRAEAPNRAGRPASRTRRKDPGSSPREARDQRELHVSVVRIRSVRSDRLEDTGQSQGEQHQSEDDCDRVRKGYMRPQQDVVQEARVRAYVVPRFWHTGVLFAHRSYGRLPPPAASEPLETLRLKAPDALRGCIPAPIDQW